MDRMFYIAFSMVTTQTSCHYQKPLECYRLAEPLICAWIIKDKNRLLPSCFISSSLGLINGACWPLYTQKAANVFAETGIKAWILVTKHKICSLGIVPRSLKLCHREHRCAWSWFLFFIKVISWKWFVSHVTHLAPNTPEQPDVCSMLFS